MSEIKMVHVREEGDMVLLLVDGKGLLMPPQAAIELANALTFKAKLIENRADPEGQAFDQGLLLRAGVPLNLTTDKRILEMAKTEAAHNTVLRKNIPMTANNVAKIGTPLIIQGPGKR